MMRRHGWYPEGGRVVPWFWAVPLLLLMPSLASAAGATLLIPPPESETPSPVEVQADTMEFLGETFRATGSVIVRQGGRILESSSIVYNRTAGEITAEGDVRLQDGDDTLTTPKFLWNLKTQQGTLYQGSLYLKKDNYHIQGDLIQRESPDRYAIRSATFTTCDGTPPSWQFRGKDIQIHLDHFLTARHVSFAVENVPLLYFPYLVLPIQQTRQTGLLIPRVGYNSGEGLKVNNAFFWAIAGNQDATFYGDYYGEKGLGGGLEYRYILNHDTRGQLNGYFLKDRQVSENRWYIRFRHLQRISEQTTARLKLITLNDKKIFKDISEETEDRLLRSQDSDFYLTRQWEVMSTHLWAQYTQNFEGSTREVFQRLPEAGIILADRKIASFPVYYSLQSSAVRWESKDQEISRFQIFPEITVRIPLGPVGMVPRAGLRQLYYAPVQGDHTSQRSMESFSLDLHLRADRTYPHVKHIVEPTLRFEKGELRTWGEPPPVFDSNETTGGGNLVTLILLNRWLTHGLPSKPPHPGPPPQGGKVEESKDGIREVAYLRLSQGYQLFHSVEAQDPPMGRATDLRTEVILRPDSRWSLDLDTRYNHKEHRMDSVDTDFRWELAMGEFEVGQRYTHDPEIRFLTSGGGIRFRNLDTRVKAWYDAQDHILREGRTSIESTFQCWGVTFSYTYRPEETQFNVLFTLKGVGSVGG